MIYARVGPRRSAGNGGGVEGTLEATINSWLMNI